MAVTINEMQVDVEDKAAPAKTSREPLKPRVQKNLRFELEILAERELRLKGD